jgi:hypothetical protein
MYDRFHDEGKDELMKNYMNMMQAEDERERAMR